MPRNVVVSLNPSHREQNELLALCRKIVQFVKWKKWWPTVGDLHRKYSKPSKNYWTLSAIQHYIQVGQEKGWLEKHSSSSWRLTSKFFYETFTEPVEAIYSSSGSARAKQKSFRAKLYQGIRRLKRAGLYEESEIEKYERTKSPSDPTCQQLRYGETSQADWYED